MNMKVFYSVQVSNTTIIDNEPKWMLRNDACVNIAIGIISAILDIKKDIEFLIKLPNIDDVIDIDNYEELFESKYKSNVSFYTEQIPISPIESRFSFNFDYHKSCIDIFKDIDVMINDENTLTKNWNVLFNSLKLNIPIVSTNYFLDSPIAKKVPEKIRYYERQMESFINSDIAAFQCKVGMDEALEAFDILYKDRNFIKKTSVWGVGASYKEISKYHNIEKFDVPTIYFGNRITDTANRYTNWHVFAETIGKLETNIKYKAIMLNPTHKISQQQFKEIIDLSKGRVEVIPNETKFTRDEYLKFINKSHISCNLFVNEVHGGVTSVEAGLAKNIVIMPNVNNYKYKVEKYSPNYVFAFDIENNKIDTKKLAEIIEYAFSKIGTKEYNYWSEESFKIHYSESYEMASERIIDDLDYLMKLRKSNHD